MHEPDVVLSRRADGQVGSGVTVEVPGRQGEPESVASFGRAGEAVLSRRADGQVGSGVTVEVTSRQSKAEDVASFGRTGDPGAVLGPQLATGGGQPSP